MTVVDAEGRAWGTAERPFAGFLDGWAVVSCGHVVRVLYDEQFPECCPECEAQS